MYNSNKSTQCMVVYTTDTEKDQPNSINSLHTHTHTHTHTHKHTHVFKIVILNENGHSIVRIKMTLCIVCFREKDSSTPVEEGTL